MLSDFTQTMQTQHEPLAITYLSHSDIYPDPDNPREVFAEAELEELRASLSEYGIHSPIAVRLLPNRYSGARYRIIFGERRWRASEGVMEKLPCIIRDVDDATAREMALDENFQREDLTVEEESTIVKGYLELNFSISQIARKRNKSDGWVNNRIAYLKVGEDVREVGKRVRKKLSSLVWADKVKKGSDLRKELLHRIEVEEMPFVEVKAKVETHIEAIESAKRAAANAAAQSRAPDAETQERSQAHSRGESSSVSRGIRVTRGGSSAPKIASKAAKIEANNEVLRAMKNQESWLPLCDNDTHQAATDLARRILRGDLARSSSR